MLAERNEHLHSLGRFYDGKREVRVYDYADLNLPMLGRMFDRRCHGYEAIDYTLELPGSAVPGWPADVPHPVDPGWKSRYAASVRRLVRDGVDSPLGLYHIKMPESDRRGGRGALAVRTASPARSKVRV